MSKPKSSKKKCFCIPKCRPPQLENCKQLIHIIKELTEDSDITSVHRDQDQSPARSKKVSRRRYGHDSRTCVPMVPSMHTRLRIRGEHCRYDYDKSQSRKKSSKADRKNNTLKSKSVHYEDLLSMPCPVLMPEPLSKVKHTESCISILRVSSPKVSGEVVNARPASLTPSEYRAPLPSKRTLDVHEPRSGLYINVTKEFAPDFGGLGFGVAKPGTKRGICRRARKSTKIRCNGYNARHTHYKKQAQKRRDKRRCGGHMSQAYANVGSAEYKPRYERSTQKHLLDDDSACSADQIPCPQNVTIPKNLKRGTLQTHSMTITPCPGKGKPEIHFGILNGVLNMYDSKYGARSKGQQAVTMSVMAYCLAYHYHPKHWTMELIDNVLDCGDRWYLQCLEKLHDHSAVQGICEVLAFGKKHTLILNGKKMQVLLQEPDVVGYTMALDPTVYNLCRGLKVFFKNNRAGIFLSRILKVLIWKDSVCFYIFDPAGRDAKAYANSKEGKAALLNVQDLEGVTEVLLARSVIEDQKYVLAALKVLRMVDEDSPEDFGSDHEMTPAERAMAEYRILSETCAIVNAKLHLGDPCFEQVKFRQALPIAIVAMAYAKVSPPNTWNTKSLDKILRLGSKLFVDCSDPKVLTDITIDNIPTDIAIGPYRCEIIIYRERVKGQLFTKKECLLNIDLGLKDFFSKEHNSGIIQFNNYTLAVWRQRDMYYIFDPYPCSADGLKSTKGKACVLMHLNPESAAAMFAKSWDYLPATTQFYIHGFKVLKLKKEEFKAEIVCMSDEDLGTKSRPRTPKKRVSPCHHRGDSPDPAEIFIHKEKEELPIFDEQAGDIASLLDSIHEDDVPQIPLQYKIEPVPPLPKMADLDSPTVSATQIVPPLPLPRDKTGEPPEPDPDPEPEPPPPPEPKGEGAEELEEEEEEEEVEEEEEPAIEEVVQEPSPPPPPSPEPEPDLAPVEMTEDEAQTLKQDVKRKILLTTDARYNAKLREHRGRMSAPLEEDELSISQSLELLMPSNFNDIPDGTQIILGSSVINSDNAEDLLPFVSIMAIVTSYKYKINSWSKCMVDFVVETARKLYENKQEKFQFAPIHVIPKIAIGQQAYEACIDVASDGATWQLEHSLSRFFQKYNRCMITTASYSCAAFRKNGLYYLFDGSPCNAVGLRDCGKKGNSAFMRFGTLHGLVHRILYNKDGNREIQQFIMSRVLVKRLVTPLRERLPDTGSNTSVRKKHTTEFIEDPPKGPKLEEPRAVGYKRTTDGVSTIEGTTALKSRKASSGVKECHFIGAVVMLMLAMHPIRTWDGRMIDAAFEKGVEIYERACNLSLCEKRVIKHILMEGKFFNVNIKKVLVINENVEKSIDEYMEAVLSKLRYVILRYPECSMVIYRDENHFHLFDAYGAPKQATDKSCDANDSSSCEVATWTQYPDFDSLLRRIKLAASTCNVHNPIFYTYELTSVKKAPKRAVFNYKLSPIFRANAIPNKLHGRRKMLPVIDEKVNWVYVKKVPWTRGCPYNDLGHPRNTVRSLWKDWDIEFPGDLYSLWGTVHPLSSQFSEDNRGKQILAINVVAIAMTKYYELSEWTSNVLNAIVCYGDKYHSRSAQSIGDPNHEMSLCDLEKKFNMYPYSFSATFEKIIFGTVYSIHKDSMNVSRALVYFLECNRFGILICQRKNIAFGKTGNSYFMFDSQSYGPPQFAPRQGAAYVLKCESLNRLIYCVVVTLNVKKHGVEFDIFSVNTELSNMSVEKS